MKRPFKFILFAALIFAACGLFGGGGGGGDEPSDEGLAYTLINDGAAYEVSIGSADAENIVIPAEHNGLPVTAVADDGFASNVVTYKREIKSVTIPDSATRDISYP